jgi:hypothetical protein
VRARKAGGGRLRPPRCPVECVWYLVELIALAPRSLDVMLEAKAKDAALLWLRRQLATVAPEIAAAEETARGAIG